MESGILGKKVFFLYPPPVLKEVAEELVKQEYEVYFSHDHEKLRRTISSFPDAIVFVNLDDGLDESGWLAYVKSLRSEAPAIGVGIVTLNDDPELREHYLMNVEVQCGFVILKIGAAKTTEIILKALDANEARGRRKFVRAACSPGTAQCSFDHEGATLKAELTDLSSAGMAIKLENGSSIKAGSVLRDIVLTIKGQRILVSGVVVAKRAGEDGSEPVHALMFDPNSLDETKRLKLKTLVSRINQASMDTILDKAFP